MFTVDLVVKSIETEFKEIAFTSVFHPDLVEIVSGGVFDGKRIPALCSSPEVALELLWDAYVKYRKYHPGDKLVWRIMPEVSERDAKSKEEFERWLEEPHKYYSAYMRIAIR
jgi:hypothetical protein